MGTGLQKFEKYLELRVLQKKFKKNKIQNHIGGSIKPKINQMFLSKSRTKQHQYKL